jgi:hypothetical protein
MRHGRREFLECAMAGAAGVLLCGRVAAAGKAKPGHCDPYELVALGKTPLKVTRVGLGTGVRAWMRKSNHTRMGPKKFDALVHAAGKGVIAMKVLGAGTFAKNQRQREASIRYVLDLDCVDAMVVGFETPGQLDDFAARVRGRNER